VDAARAARKEALFVSFPRAPIVYSGLGATLYYSIFYHSYETKGKAKEIVFLPENIRKTFRVSEKRFFWLKLRALSCQKQWVAVKQLPSTVRPIAGSSSLWDQFNDPLPVQSLFSSRPSSPIGFNPFIDAVRHFPHVHAR
jgi:hypothetical protein